MMRMGTTVAAMVAGALLVACSPSDAPAPMEPHPAVESTAPEVVPVEPPSATASALPPDSREPVPPPSLVAAMTCEPVSDVTLAAHVAEWGGPDWADAVQVPVGEGLIPGEEWLLLVAELDDGTARVRLTNAESAANPGSTLWLYASDFQASDTDGETRFWKHFPTVDWDPSEHQWLHAGTAKGFECLGLEYPAPVASEPAEATGVEPDAGLVDALECVPLTDETKQEIYRRFGGHGIDGVSIALGEGLNEGEEWWLIAYDFSFESDDGPRAPDRPSWVTNHFGGPDFQDERWLPTYYDGSGPASFGGRLQWDAERMERAQSALVKAWQCIGDAES